MDDEHLDGDAPDAHVIADGQTAETNGGCPILHERLSSVERWDSKVTVLNRMCNSIADRHEHTAEVALV